MDIAGLWPAARLPSSAAASRPRRLRVLERLIVARQIVEAGDRGIELQVDVAGGAMTLLADDDLGLAVGRIHLGLPLDVVVGARPWLLVAEVILLAEHEQHHVGVLLDRA